MKRTKIAAIARAASASLIIAAIVGAGGGGSAGADITRWDNNQTIPGTEGITLGPGIDLSGWNSTTHNLQYGNLSSKNLNGTIFTGTWLDYAHLIFANLTAANMSNASLSNVSFRGANLTNANLTGATVIWANFSAATGFSLAQLRSTASYHAGDLTGIGLGSDNLAGWDFAGQNLSMAHFEYATLTNAKLSGANVASARFNGTTGFTLAQLQSTASYQAKMLTGIDFTGDNLAGWDFSNQTLSWAIFDDATLTNVNFTGAIVNGTMFYRATSHGFTQAQLQSTTSYQLKNLRSIVLSSDDLTGWDLSGQNLSGANLASSILTNTSLAGATVAAADLDSTTSRGFTQAQLQSTASYKGRDLRGIYLDSNDLTAWDLSNQYLFDAKLANSNLTNANLSKTTLSAANFTSANLTGADLRAAFDFSPSTATTTNVIWPDGHIHGLDLTVGKQLLVRDYEGNRPIVVDTAGTLDSSSDLQVILSDASWGSTMGLGSGVSGHFAGKLDVLLNAGFVPQAGESFNLFDGPWTGSFDELNLATLPGGLGWDSSQLYTTGELTITPEPATLALLVLGGLGLIGRRMRRRS